MNSQNPERFLFRLETFKGPAVSDVLEHHGSQCTLGRHPMAEFRLPKSEYPDVGPKELRFEWSGAGIAIFHLRPGLNLCRVGGQPVDGQVLLEGEHEIEINDHRFLLTLIPLPGDPPGFRLDDALEFILIHSDMDADLTPEARNALAALQGALANARDEASVTPATRARVLEAFAGARAATRGLPPRGGTWAGEILEAGARFLGIHPREPEALEPAPPGAPEGEARDTEGIPKPGRRPGAPPADLEGLDEWLASGHVPDPAVLRALAEAELARGQEARLDYGRLAIAAAMLGDPVLYRRIVRAEYEGDYWAYKRQKWDGMPEEDLGRTPSEEVSEERVRCRADYVLVKMKSLLRDRILGKLAEFRQKKAR
jgi:hypothetical protein